MDQGADQMDPHTVFHTKGDVIWALAPKAKNEIMRGQWGRELKDVDLQELLELFKKPFTPARNVFHCRAQFFNIKQEEWKLEMTGGKTWMNTGNDWWILRENVNLTG